MKGWRQLAWMKPGIRPTTVNPEDFDAFWTGAIAEARKQPLDPKMTLLPERCTSTQNVYHVSFQNERPGSRIWHSDCTEENW